MFLLNILSQVCKLKANGEWTKNKTKKDEK